MKSVTLLIFLVAANFLLTGADAQVASRRCTQNIDCSTGCCINHSCTNAEWCPCSHLKNPCGPFKLCESQDVVCIRAPCYPIAKCVNA